MSFLSDPIFEWTPIVGLFLLIIGWGTAFVTESARPEGTLSRTRSVSAGALLLSALTLLRVALEGPWVIETGSLLWLPLALKYDMLSGIMLTLVSLVGAICIRFSTSYLDGEVRQADFLARMILTIILVSILVSSGTLFTLWLAWVGVSLSLDTLLVFYGERKQARSAARKKFIISRVSDTALAASFAGLIYIGGSSDITTLTALGRSDALNSSDMLTASMVLLAVAAGLKSAMVPAHSWLTEVMETPTPVSALLHAGIVNAGGFLVLRFADIMVSAPDAMLFLAIIGGLTAMTGSLVMLFQTSIKVSLAWSTIAQMGFMLLQCGLGAFTAAAIHIVAHSFYKAHAFLSSGSVIDTARVMTLAGRLPAVNPVARACIIGAVSLLYGVLVFTSGDSVKIGPALLGLVAVIGLTQFLMDEHSKDAPLRLMLRLLVTAIAGAGAYLALHSASTFLLGGTVPSGASAVWQAPLAGSLALSFIALALFRGWLVNPKYQGSFRTLKVHIANGFYISAWADRLVGRYRTEQKG